MLDILCGSKTREKILLFLFVNGKCYGTQVCKELGIALTPVQKALMGLEKAQIIVSDYEGKTRIYRFNPFFPLLAELEALLKKAYTLLEPKDKKQYALIAREKIEENPLQIVLSFWQRLSSVTQLCLMAKTKSQEGLNGQGRADVIVQKEGDNILTFHEKGVWLTSQAQETVFSNVYRFTLDRRANLISMEHLRHGIQRPVFLFHLSPSDQRTLSSVDSHLCGEDTYLGKVFCDQKHLRLHWRVIGPRKNDEIDCVYS